MLSQLRYTFRKGDERVPRILSLRTGIRLPRIIDYAPFASKGFVRSPGYVEFTVPFALLIQARRRG